RSMSHRTRRDPEAAAFAAIISRLSDPEGRRARRIAVAVSAACLATAVVVLWLQRWPQVAIASFALTFLAGLVAGLFVMARQLFHR
ncbi:MAG: hypothetical protein LC799_28930, partial [Actinobacteria bacterium]|nr:hypothetical protein [Actinomycetota bacterium]